jgi:hypothetical protein
MLVCSSIGIRAWPFACKSLLKEKIFMSYLIVVLEQVMGLILKGSN